MPARPAPLQDFVTPDVFAAHYGFSERTVREQARALGACALLGNRMILLPDHCAMILEAAKPCPSPSTVAAKSGTTGVPLPEGSYAALQAQRTKALPNGSKPRSKAKRGVVVSMDRGRA